VEFLCQHTLFLNRCKLFTWFTVRFIDIDLFKKNPFRSQLTVT